MKYKNYEIIRADEMNLKLVKYEEKTAAKDIHSTKTGELTRAKGDKYTATVFKGYYPSLRAALAGLCKDMLGKDCEAIKDVIRQIEKLRTDLIEPTTNKAK